jgi:hypothetical protein
MGAKEEEYKKEYNEKLAEVKNRKAPFTKVPKGMFWKPPSGIDIKDGYKPVPEDKRHAEWKQKWGVDTAPEEEVRQSDGWSECSKRSELPNVALYEIPNHFTRRFAPRLTLTSRDSLRSSQYWFHPAIHTFGNVGFTGGVHSVAAPLATKIIDTLAYEGRSVREEIGEMLREKVGSENKKIIDMGCGVGISTRALAKAFSKPSNTVVGLDTSREMLKMAKLQTKYQRAKDR